jgi:large subunit ribosomal protein L35
MPKMKTNSSAKKRFSFTGSGKIKRKHAFKNHILTKKETKQKHNLGKFAIVDPRDEGRIKALLAIGK